MPALFTRQSASRSIAKGLLAGLLGGLAGSVAKIAGEMLYNPRTEGQVSPPILLAERIAGHPLTHTQQQASQSAIHFTFGAATGAVYGAVAEVAPIVTAGYGSVFGVVLQLCTHETLVPAAGLDKPAPQQPMREHLSELFTHVLYGIATEVVRRIVRKRLA
jgi:putative membrane protein